MSRFLDPSPCPHDVIYELSPDVIADMSGSQKLKQTIQRSFKKELADSDQNHYLDFIQWWIQLKSYLTTL